MPSLRPLVKGLRFGRLVVLERAANRKDRVAWFCLCDCGTQVVVRGDHLKSGNTMSCGCLHSEIAGMDIKKRSTTHGMRKSPTYTSWLTMRERCNNPKNEHYNYYGGRGIRVHSDWDKSFTSFWFYMGDRPAGMTIDRIDPDGNYEPGNVRWATASEQRANQRVG